jgi:hypothetical protein
MFGSIIFFYLYPLSGDGPVWHLGSDVITIGCKNPTVLMKMFLMINNYKPVHKDPLDSIHEYVCKKTLENN